MKATIELAFNVIIDNEEVIKRVKLTDIEMCPEFFKDFSDFYNGKSCTATMTTSSLGVEA